MMNDYDELDDFEELCDELEEMIIDRILRSEDFKLINERILNIGYKIDSGIFNLIFKDLKNHGEKMYIQVPCSFDLVVKDNPSVIITDKDKEFLKNLGIE